MVCYGIIVPSKKTAIYMNIYEMSQQDDINYNFKRLRRARGIHHPPALWVLDAFCSIFKKPKVQVSCHTFDHDTGPSHPGKPPPGFVGLLDLQAPCSPPFCVLQVQFQITEAKLRPVLNHLSLPGEHCSDPACIVSRFLF